MNLEPFVPVCVIRTAGSRVSEWRAAHEGVAADFKMGRLTIARMAREQVLQEQSDTSMADPITKAVSKPAPLRFFLGEDDFDGQVTVSLESFLLFDNDMTHGLDNLERRWSNWSTPNSLRRDIWENVNR